MTNLPADRPVGVLAAIKQLEVDAMARGLELGMESSRAEIERLKRRIEELEANPPKGETNPQRGEAID